MVWFNIVYVGLTNYFGDEYQEYQVWDITTAVTLVY